MDIILQYFPDITDLQKQQFSQLSALYSFWNHKINVISRKDIDHLYERHVLHSLSIARFFNFTDNTLILDVGTGGGFPGIPLAIYFPHTRFVLTDSIGKKIKVVQEIIKEIKITNVQAIHARAETLPDKFDYVVSRAVCEFSQFVKLVRNKISEENSNPLPNGIIYLKGGDLENEIRPFRQKVKIFNLSEKFKEDFFESKKIIYLPV
jgi:16S rRNA (guanine527-N7)-methyltransferase